MRVTTDVEERAKEAKKKKKKTAPWTAVRVGIRSGYAGENDTLSSWNTPLCSGAAKKREEDEGEEGCGGVSAENTVRHQQISCLGRVLRECRCDLSESLVSFLRSFSLLLLFLSHPLFPPFFSSRLPPCLSSAPVICTSRFIDARQRAVRHEILR